MAYIAPAGTPITLTELLNSLAGTMRPHLASLRLATSLSEIAGSARIYPISSGRAAMTTILKAMRSACGDANKDEVIIPAYTCYSVPAAIQRAGLRPRLCDVDPNTLGMNPDSLKNADFSRTLAVISANLYGLPDDLVSIESICQGKGVYLLDDAAQALGASLAGRPVGSFGDAGLFSFDKGKIVCTMQGGAIVASSESMRSALGAEADQLPASAALDSVLNFAKLIAYSICLRPSIYGMVRTLPGTGLGQTRYETRYPVSALSGFQSHLAADLVGRLEHLNESRRRNAAMLAEATTDLSGVEAVQLLVGARPAYARFPLRILDPTRRTRMIDALERAGIGATASYPRSLADVPEVVAIVSNSGDPMPGARSVASSMLTLPTHAYCPPDMSERVRNILTSC